MRPRSWTFSALILSTIMLLVSGCDSGSTEAPDVTSLSLSDNLPMIPRGGSKTLTLEVADLDGNMISWLEEGVDVAWSSSNTAILTIDDRGVATGVSRGKAHITARTGVHEARIEIDVIDLAGTWTATVPDAQAPGGVNVITYQIEQTGLSVSGTYSNLSGFPPLTSTSTGRFSGTMNLKRIGSSVTLQVQVAGPPCSIAWTNELRLDLNPTGTDRLTPVATTVPLTSATCPNAGQIRVAQVSRSGS